MQIKIWLGPIEPKPNTPAYDCHRQDRHSRDQKFLARFCRTFAAFERPQIAMHLSSRRVTLFGIVRAMLEMMGRCEPSANIAIAEASPAVVAIDDGLE